MNQGSTAEYVWTELQEVSGVGRDPMIGHTVRFNMGPAAPSRALILGMRDAVNLHNDLGRTITIHRT